MIDICGYFNNLYSSSLVKGLLILIFIGNKTRFFTDSIVDIKVFKSFPSPKSINTFVLGNSLKGNIFLYDLLPIEAVPTLNLLCSNVYFLNACMSLLSTFM